MDDLIQERIGELAAGVEVPRGNRPGFFRALFSASEETHGPRQTVLPAINALIDLHGVAKADSPASLPVFIEALPHALSLLSHDDDGIRMQSLALIAAVRAEPATVVPRLIEELQRSRQEAWRYEFLIPKTIAAFGADAAPAMPILIEVMQADTDHNTVTWCAQALAEIGPAAVSAVPAMEAARERLTRPIKSDDKSFKSAMNRAIRQLQQSARPPRPAPKRSAGEAYLLDLMDRLAQPADGLHEPVRQEAWAEAKALSDPALLADLAALMTGTPGLKTPQMAEAASLLGFLTRNTNSAEGRRLILDLLSRPGLPDRVQQPAIYAAAKNEMREAIPLMRPLLRAGNVYALQFAESLKLEECVPDVIEYMKTEPGNVLGGIFALEAIGSTTAIPILMEYAAREYTSRKAMERDWRFYAIYALGHLGDRSVVPFLVNLLTPLDDWEAAPHIDALQKLADIRAHDAVVQALRRIVDGGIGRPDRLGWSEGHRTPIVNALDLFLKVGTNRRPEVLAVVDRLRAKTVWQRLLPEEQAFIGQWEPS